MHIPLNIALVYLLIGIGAACSPTPEPSKEEAQPAEESTPDRSLGKSAETGSGATEKDACGQAYDACKEAVDKALTTCKRRNAKKAEFLCKGDERYASVADCIDAALNGFPGLSVVAKKGDANWEHARSVLAKRSDLATDVASDDSATIRLDYPAAPVDRRIYPDCAGQAVESGEACKANRLGCQDTEPTP